MDCADRLGRSDQYRGSRLRDDEKGHRLGNANLFGRNLKPPRNYEQSQDRSMAVEFYLPFYSTPRPMAPARFHRPYA